MTMKRWEASRIEGYTDGGCHGNPGPGGWGWALYEEGQLIHHNLGPVHHTTNNRMEMRAFLELLTFCIENDIDMDEIYSDSTLVVRGVNEWMKGWKARGWKKSGNKELLNKELWVCIDNALIAYKNKFKSTPVVTWVKAHATDPGNIFVDSLTQVAIAEIELEKF